MSGDRDCACDGWMEYKRGGPDSVVVQHVFAWLHDVEALPLSFPDKISPRIWIHPLTCLEDQIESASEGGKLESWCAPVTN